MNRFCFAVVFLLAAPGAGFASTVDEMVEQLESPSSAIRAAAAKELRELLASDPSLRSNDHGRDYWQARVDKVRVGMPRDEVLKLLPFADPNQPHEIMDCSGQSCNAQWRLDDYWVVNIIYLIGPTPDDAPDASLEDRLMVHTEPKLVERADSKGVTPPEDYTGVWVTWYVNGQKAYENDYENGESHGVLRSFHDNGKPATTQAFRRGVAHGSGRGWDRDGNRSYEIT